MKRPSTKNWNQRLVLEGKCWVDEDEILVRLDPSEGADYQCMKCSRRFSIDGDRLIEWIPLSDDWRGRRSLFFEDEAVFILVDRQTVVLACNDDGMVTIPKTAVYLQALWNITTPIVSIDFANPKLLDESESGGDEPSDAPEIVLDDPGHVAEPPIAEESSILEQDAVVMVPEPVTAVSELQS